jgi:hypothetical protein
MLSESWREADPTENGESAGFLAPLVGDILAITLRSDLHSLFFTLKQIRLQVHLATQQNTQDNN